VEVTVAVTVTVARRRKGMRRGVAGEATRGER
jgi:hypothetical protein